MHYTPTISSKIVFGLVILILISIMFYNGSDDKRLKQFWYKHEENILIIVLVMLWISTALVTVAVIIESMMAYHR